MLFGTISMTCVHVMVWPILYLGYFPRYYPNTRGILLLSVVNRIAELMCT